MKFIIIFLFVLQLGALIQSQSDGYGSSPSDGSGAGDNSVQPSHPATTAGPSQTSNGESNSQSNIPSATSQTAGQTTAASPSISNPTTVATSQSQTNQPTHTHSSNSAGRTASSSTFGSDATNLPESQNSNGSSNDIGPIVGGVVGGVVGLALIGGLLAWLNRRGGCTSRKKRRRHNTTFDDFTLNTDDNNNNAIGVISDTTGGSSSPFQRRMAPMAQTSYMDLGNTNTNDDYSETTTAVPLSGYPKATLHDSFKQHPSDSYYGYANNQHLDPWQQYDHSSTSPQTPNTYDHRVKPDTVDYKPHQI